MRSAEDEKAEYLVITKEELETKNLTMVGRSGWTPLCKLPNDSIVLARYKDNDRYEMSYEVCDKIVHDYLNSKIESEEFINLLKGLCITFPVNLKCHEELKPRLLEIISSYGDSMSVDEDKVIELSDHINNELK